MKNKPKWFSLSSKHPVAQWKKDGVAFYEVSVNGKPVFGWSPQDGN